MSVLCARPGCDQPERGDKQVLLPDGGIGIVFVPNRYPGFLKESRLRRRLVVRIIRILAADQDPSHSFLAHRPGLFDARAHIDAGGKHDPTVHMSTDPLPDIDTVEQRHNHSMF